MPSEEMLNAWEGDEHVARKGLRTPLDDGARGQGPRLTVAMVPEDQVSEFVGKGASPSHWPVGTSNGHDGRPTDGVDHRETVLIGVIDTEDCDVNILGLLDQRDDVCDRRNAKAVLISERLGCLPRLFFVGGHVS